MRQVVERTGQRYGKLVVTGRAPGSPQSKWFCRCDCGKEIVAFGNNLGRGNTTSCGCSRLTHAMTGTKVYHVWQQMLQRCENPNDAAYKNYGGRGIIVSEEWHSFDAFFRDMGYPPHGGTLERNENEQPYCKENCRWASRREQSRNKRSNRVLVAFGKSQVLQDWADEYQLPLTTLRNRIDRGKWPLELALTTPLQKGVKLQW